MSTDAIRTIWDGHLDFHTAPELCVNTDSRSMLLSVHTAPEFCEFKFEFNQCGFTSTETMLRTTRDWGAQDGRLDFHTASELCG